MRLLITGASGAGTTTLGTALSSRLKIHFFDTDDYFWVATNPPYVTQRTPEERLALLQNDLKRHKDWVLAGSVVGWGIELEDIFSVIVFLYTETKVRMQRLKDREISRHGRADPEFLKWAEQYDAGTAEGRSLPRHTTWLERRSCPVIRLDGAQSLDTGLLAVLSKIESVN